MGGEGALIRYTSDDGKREEHSAESLSDVWGGLPHQNGHTVSSPVH